MRNDDAEEFGWITVLEVGRKGDGAGFDSAVIGDDGGFGGGSFPGSERVAELHGISEVGCFAPAKKSGEIDSILSDDIWRSMTGNVP